MRDWLRSGGSIPREPELVTDLVGLTYGFAPGGQIKLESKEDLKKRGLPSPDRADSLALTFYSPVFARRDGAWADAGRDGVAAGSEPMDATGHYNNEYGGIATYDGRWVDERTTF